MNFMIRFVFKKNMKESIIKNFHFKILLKLFKKIFKKNIKNLNRLNLFKLLLIMKIVIIIISILNHKILINNKKKENQY